MNQTQTQKRQYSTDKSLTKDNRITVRLTPNQYNELNNISKVLKMTKGALIRRITDSFIDKYYELR